MKLVIDEKLKHRLVGLSVIVSLGAIFIPAMMKKSSQHLENSLSVNVKIPPKPIAPNVVITDENQMFKTIKVAKIIDLDTKDYIASAAIDEESLNTVVLATPEPELVAKPIEQALSDAAKHVVKKQATVVAETKTTKLVKPFKAKPAAAKPVVAKVIKAPLMKKNVYALQLASFAKLGNAQALVSKLQKKGYKANYMKVASRNGAVYKVYAGHSPVKDNVVRLRTQLASAMRLNGFVVNTGVS